MSSQDRFLVTGGNGFFGSWIVRQLLAEGAEVSVLDLRPDDRIAAQVLEPAAIRGLRRFHGDIADPRVVYQAVVESGATSIIHLAGMQIPACKADPVAGARVNIIGTLNVFEVASRHREQVRRIVYASSAAVAGPASDYASSPISDGAHHEPRTFYGVYKLAGEGCARIYWQDHGIPSVGLRPLVVYGVGREVGISSGPTKAIKAALIGRSFTIPFSGVTGFSYVEDVAATFAACARARLDGAHAFNMRGEILDVADFVRALDLALPGAASRIRIEGPTLPVAHDVGEAGLAGAIGTVPHTPVPDGIARTIERFRRLQALGALPVGDLDA